MRYQKPCSNPRTNKKKRFVSQYLWRSWTSSAASLWSCCMYMEEQVGFGGAHFKPNRHHQNASAQAQQA
eukprot:1146063-Pelagomonas_calceolata.AAC.10